MTVTIITITTTVVRRSGEHREPIRSLRGGQRTTIRRRRLLNARLEPRREQWRVVQYCRNAPTLVSQTLGTGTVGPYGAVADRHDHLRSGHPGHQQRWRRTSHHAAIDNHALVKHTVVDASDHVVPSARDDDGTCTTRDHPTLDAATSSSSLVERQRAADTRITPVPRPGDEPVDLQTPWLRSKARLGQPLSRSISQRCHYEQAYAA
jgi:hypothetical protein